MMDDNVSEGNDQKIIVPEGFTYEQVLESVDKGAKFVVFEYNRSVFFILSLRRFSPAILIRNEEELAKHVEIYNRKARLYGWWAIPNGIPRTLKSIKTNNGGGIEVTNDILANLTPDSINTLSIKMEYIHSVFVSPEKDDLVLLDKLLTNRFAFDGRFKTMYCGLYMNTGEYVDPYVVIGFQAEGDFVENVEFLRKILYKKYLSTYPFDFMDLNQEDDMNDLLKEQGVKLF